MRGVFSARKGVVFFLLLSLLLAAFPQTEVSAQGTKILPGNPVMARRMVPQGAVLLRNESDVLPLPHGERVAVFGSGQLAFQPGGGGSGFLSHTPFSTLLDALRRESDSGSLLLEPETEKAYRTDRNLKVTPEFAKRARSGADTALIVLSRFAEEGRDRSSGPGGWLLTPEEEEMFHSIRNAGFEKTVVILNTPGPIDTSYYEKVKRLTLSVIFFYSYLLNSASKGRGLPSVNIFTVFR